MYQEGWKDPKMWIVSNDFEKWWRISFWYALQHPNPIIEDPENHGTSSNERHSSHRIEGQWQLEQHKRYTTVSSKKPRKNDVAGQEQSIENVSCSQQHCVQEIEWGSIQSTIQKFDILLCNERKCFQIWINFYFNFRLKNKDGENVFIYWIFVKQTPEGHEHSSVASMSKCSRHWKCFGINNF